MDYIEKIIVPYIIDKKSELGLPSTQTSLVIFDEFNGQTTNDVLALLNQHNILYVIVCTDRLSVNKPAKEFLRSKFQAWYASQVSTQGQAGSVIKPIDLKLSTVKPLGAKWLIELYDYFKKRPEIIINGFKATGIIDVLKS